MLLASKNVSANSCVVRVVNVASASISEKDRVNNALEARASTFNYVRGDVLIALNGEVLGIVGPGFLGDEDMLVVYEDDLPPLDEAKFAEAVAWLNATS